MKTTVPLGRPAWSHKASIADYGGSLLKESAPEGEQPYAAQWYREIQAMRGSAYSQETGTLVHAETLAQARLFGHVWSRMPEKVRANQTPSRASDKLAYWVKRLRVTVRPDDSDDAIRIKCAAKFKVATGASLSSVEEACRTLLGDWFVAILLSRGVDLDIPPLLTFWPTVNPGPASYDIGGGCWSSERSHVTVQVQRPAGADYSAFYELVNGQLYELLDTMLPAWCSFNWATSAGFLVDISQLDFDGL